MLDKCPAWLSSTSSHRVEGDKVTERCNRVSCHSDNGDLSHTGDKVTSKTRKPLQTGPNKIQHRVDRPATEEGHPAKIQKMSNTVHSKNKKYKQDLSSVEKSLSAKILQKTTNTAASKHGKAVVNKPKQCWKEQLSVEKRSSTKTQKSPNVASKAHKHKHKRKEHLSVDGNTLAHIQQRSVGKHSSAEKCGNDVLSSDAQWPCGQCGQECLEGVVCCDGCDLWYHYACMGISEEEGEKLGQDDDTSWFCTKCSRS